MNIPIGSFVVAATLVALAMPAAAQTTCTVEEVAPQAPTALVISDCTKLLSTERSPAMQSKIHRYRGLTYIWQGDDALGLADYAEAIRLDPTNARAYTTRASYYAKDGRDLTKALADATTAIDVAPTDYSLYQFRAEIHMARGELEAVVADYDTALTMHPDDAEILLARGDAWRARGDYRKALADYEAAATIDPLFASDLSSKVRAIMSVVPTLSMLVQPGEVVAAEQFRRVSTQPRDAQGEPMEVWCLDGKVHHCATSMGVLGSQAALGRSAAGYAIVLSSAEWAFTPQAAYAATVQVDTPPSLPAKAFAFDPKTIGVPMTPDPAFHAAWAGSFGMTVKTERLEVKAVGVNQDELKALDDCWAQASDQPGKR